MAAGTRAKEWQCVFMRSCGAADLRACLCFGVHASAKAQDTRHQLTLCEPACVHVCSACITPIVHDVCNQEGAARIMQSAFRCKCGICGSQSVLKWVPGPWGVAQALVVCLCTYLPTNAPGGAQLLAQQLLSTFISPSAVQTNASCTVPGCAKPSAVMA